MATANPRRGYILGLTAYIIWGLFPLYFKAIQSVPALEIIVHRALWSALFGALLLLVWKHPGWLRELLNNPKRFAVLALSGVLIASNWLVYVWAVNNERMLEASLGYYINPLVNVLLGMLILGERLRRLQWLAVALAALGVLLGLIINAGIARGLHPLKRLEAQLGGVGLADEQVAVELHLGGVAELTARTTLAATANAGTEVHALGLQQCFVEGGEVEALSAVFLGADIAAAAHQVGLGDIAQLLDFGEQISTGEHDVGLG